jgi:hypothetical protein
MVLQGDQSDWADVVWRMRQQVELQLTVVETAIDTATSAGVFEVVSVREGETTRDRAHERAPQTPARADRRA